LRILFLVRSLELGGAELQLLTLAKGCRDSGHEVMIVAFYPGGSLVASAGSAGVTCADLGKTGRWDLARPLRRLRRLVAGFDPQVIYSFMQSANLLAALARPLLPPHVLIWGVRATNMQLPFYGWIARAGLLAERLLWRCADAVICNSTAGAALYRGVGVESARLRVIPNAIDVELFRPQPVAGLERRRERGVPDNAALIGVVGRIDPVKGHASVIEAVGLLRSLGVDAYLWFVGSGSPALERALRQQALELGVGRIDWLGVRSDMPVVYSALDLLVSASLSEGFPNVVAEAAACGTPCVVTDVGDSATIVQDPRRVVPPAEPPALAQAMHVALRDETRGSEIWRGRITERYSRDAILRATLSALDEVLRTSAPRIPQQRAR
jgi:glycosyltransferase involved in cell wall biosynthesis